MKNKLKKVIQKRIFEANRNLKSRQKKRKASDELKDICFKLSVNYWTVFNWYRGKNNPQGENYSKLPSIFGMTEEQFYKPLKIKHAQYISKRAAISKAAN